MASPVALIFGAGSNVGQSVAKAFGAKGYELALASRSLKSDDSTADELLVPTDCADTDSVIQAFAKVRSVCGPPSVVVYNAYAGSKNSPTDVFEVPVEEVKTSAMVDILGGYAAAQEAVKGWKELPTSSNPTYIYTGNFGKAGAAAFIEVAAEAYKDKNFKFYYTDERTEDGTPMYDGPTAEGHAKLYVDLAEGTKQLHWQQTFVTGLGYKKF